MQQETDCFASVVYAGAQAYLQLDTYGSADG
ncbi:hypothetical protein BH23GEM5_BH23GEM5_07680 [soil metagenome]